MTFDLVKDILLIFVGGLITFFFTLLVGRFQRREPKLVWRRFPKLNIPTQGLTGVSWMIENSGRKSAKDVRIIFKLPRTASFTLFEVESSEDALEYSVVDDSDCSMKTIIIPVFTHDISLSVSSLISNLNKNSIDISIVGEDIVGKKMNDFSFDELDKFRKRFKYFEYISGAILGLIVIGCAVVMIIISHNFVQLDSAKHIAELYIKSNDYDGAIELYESMKSEFLLTGDLYINYNLAKLYALKNDPTKCSLYLEKVIESSDYYNDLIKTENAFDSIRSSPEFLLIMKRINKS